MPISRLRNNKNSRILGQAAHAIQPVISPLGFDWRMGVGLITGSAAKELMVSTLGVLYQLDETRLPLLAQDKTTLPTVPSLKHSNSRPLLPRP